MQNLTEDDDLQAFYYSVHRIFYSDYYLTAVSWSNDGLTAAVNWMNRAQDTAIVSLCVSPAWICTEAFRETLSGWSSLYSPAVFSANSSSFLIRAPVLDGDSGSFQQIAVVDEDLSPHFLPGLGHIEVETILGWDEKQQKM